jgi:hypothetical protein
MVSFVENIQENNEVFTYEWLGMPSEIGDIPRVLDRTMTSQSNPRAAITHAKNLLKGPLIFPAGKPYAVRVLNNDSILIWTGTVHEV